MNFIIIFSIFMVVSAVPGTIPMFPVAACPLYALNNPIGKIPCQSSDGSIGCQIFYLLNGVMSTCNNSGRFTIKC